METNQDYADYDSSNIEEYDPIALTAPNTSIQVEQEEDNYYDKYSYQAYISHPPHIQQIDDFPIYEPYEPTTSGVYDDQYEQFEPVIAEYVPKPVMKTVIPEKVDFFE